jgi:hypothetical protein
MFVTIGFAKGTEIFTADYFPMSPENVHVAAVAFRMNPTSHFSHSVADEFLQVTQLGAVH